MENKLDELHLVYWETPYNVERKKCGVCTVSLRHAVAAAAAAGAL